MKIRPDIEIAYRCFAFVADYAKQNKLYVKDVAKRLGISKGSLYEWRSGNCPDARSLAKLVRAGADANYLLTGRRKQ